MVSLLVVYLEINKTGPANARMVSVYEKSHFRSRQTNATNTRPQRDRTTPVTIKTTAAKSIRQYPREMTQRIRSSKGSSRFGLGAGVPDFFGLFCLAMALFLLPAQTGFHDAHFGLLS